MEVFPTNGDPTTKILKLRRIGVVKYLNKITFKVYI